MAVSSKYGVEAYHITDGRVDSRVFCRILPSIADRGSWCLCVMDNWRVHSSKFTTFEMEKMCLSPFFNLVGTPILNAIERVFNTLKIDFKKLRLSQIGQGDEVNVKELVRHCVENLKLRPIKNICESTIDYWLNPQF
jgi:hypothetical protein